MGQARLEELNSVLDGGDIEPDQVAQLLGTDCCFVSAACSTMKATQIDQLAEGLVILYCRSNQITRLLKWLITDEVTGTGLASKKFDVATTEGGGVKVSPVFVISALKSPSLKNMACLFIARQNSQIRLPD